MDFILFLQAFIQGVVEGVTEFLPISSTGHMIIVDRFFPMKDQAFAKLFVIVIQLGAILSVLVYFYRKIFPRKWNVDGFREMIPLWSRVVVGVIPAAVIGYKFDDFIEDKLLTVEVVAVALIVWGVALVFSGFLEKRKSNTPEIVKMSYLMAFGVGLFQCIAMIPGTSRSAVTILGAMFLGCSRPCAAEFSFFLAIPTMFGASLLKLVKSGLHLPASQWIALGIGFATAFFVAWGVIAWFMDYVKKHDFKLFGWYRIVLGSALLILLFCGVVKAPAETTVPASGTRTGLQTGTQAEPQSGARPGVPSEARPAGSSEVQHGSSEADAPSETPLEAPNGENPPLNP